MAGGHASNGAITQGSQSDGESSNTTVSPFLTRLCGTILNPICILLTHVLLQIFVGGLDSDVTDEDLRQPFSQFGEIVSVKIPMKKGCGFVQFANRCSFIFLLCLWS